MTSVKDRPETIRLDHGQCFDVASDRQIDLSSSEGKQIREFAEAYGQQNSQQWDSLTGQFQVDYDNRTLMPANSTGT